MTKTRKARTALVYNPAGRKLTINGSRRRRTTTKRRTKRRNPGTVTAIAKRNPTRRITRRRSNPASVSGLLVTAVMAGVGVSLFDVITTRVVPQSSALVRAGVKLGGAWLFQSNLGSKVPLLGKYKNDIALVLAVSGVVDLMKLYVLPLVAPALGSLGIGAGSPTLIADAGTSAGLWDNASPYGNAVQPY